MTGVTDTLAYRLGTLGGRVADRFSQAVAGYGVKPRHVALLVVIDSSCSPPAPRRPAGSTRRSPPASTTASATTCGCCWRR
ncbi:MAG: hypothetical protein E6F99_03595 [Actinobacteria bacterium]|nr:MAG: hypothetical protein E6F99_03595 [Actinomycetota bacterium]